MVPVVFSGISFHLQLINS